jgi:hypothetical protein
VYEEIADADLAQEPGEDAAVALAEGVFATGDNNLLAELLRLYQSGVDSNGCAVVVGPRGPALNPSGEIAPRDLCEATVRAHRPDRHGAGSPVQLTRDSKARRAHTRLQA